MAEGNPLCPVPPLGSSGRAQTLGAELGDPRVVVETEGVQVDQGAGAPVTRERFHPWAHPHAGQMWQDAKRVGEGERREEEGGRGIRRNEAQWAHNAS